MIEAIVFLLLIICVEAVTEILVTSSIFTAPRLLIARISGTLGVLVHCGYCTSVWVSGVFSWFFVTQIYCFFPNFWVGFIVTVFVLHRLANLFHELANKWLGRRPITFAVHKTEQVIVHEQKNDS